MRDGYPTLTLRAKPAKRLTKAVLLSLAGSLLSLGAQAAPVISSISPESGSVLNSMTITGTGFGARKGNSTVTFAGTEALRYSSWSNTRIKVMPPTSLGFQASAVVVTVAGMASNAVSSSNLPPLWVDCGDRTLAEPHEIMDITISRQLPQSGPVLVRISNAGTALEGADFSVPPVVRMNAGEAQKQFRLGVIDDRGREEDETIILTVSAEGYSSHSCQITLTDNDPFGLPAPVISKLDINEGRVGDEVWIVGSNFGATKGSSRVYFDKRQAATVGWSPTLIRATVPEEATTGNVVVQVEGQYSNGIVFTVIPKPVISSLDPTSGGVGASVEITGSHFGATKEYSSVSFNGTQAATTSWSPTLIRATVPEEATTGNVVVQVEGQYSNGIVFTVIPKPVISSLDPTSGGVGTSVEITGSHFGATKGDSSVSFNGTQAATTSWSATSITATVPEGVATGNVVVEVAGQQSDGVAFTVIPKPVISSLDPTSGGVGTSVEITGSHFGATKGDSSVSFNGTQATTTSWSATSITATVPEGAATGNVVVEVAGQQSDGVAFTVIPKPVISSLDPTSGGVGTSVEITGSHFGATKGDSSVSFNGTQAATTSWSATSITATVPEGVATGNVVVEVAGQQSDGVAFTVIPKPVISSLDPTSGGVGTSVEITGSHFGATKGDSSVSFNGTQATTTSWSATSITATVPEGAATGNVVVEVAGQQSDGVAFTVIPKPVISSLDSTSGPVGASVEFTGSHFGATKGDSSVSFNGTQATTTRWSATSITATVPEGAATGNVVVTVAGQQSDGVAFTVTGVTVVPTELTIEEGKSATYTVVLNSKPASAVTVAMFTPSGTELSVDILPVFTASNWNQPQTVTVTAGEDEDTEDGTVTITHRTTSADASYHDLTVDPLEVTIADDDTGAGVTVNPTGLTIEEGEEGTYTVVLNTEPAAAVTVTVTAGAGLTVNPQSLGFTPSNWETPRTVTVTAGEDDDAKDETGTIAHAVASADPEYSRVVVPGVRVIVADDEGTGGPGGTEELTISTTRLRITEGNMGLYTVVLNRAPVGAVTVAVAGAAGSDLTVSPASLDFTTTNWDRPQEVTVSVGHDDDLVDELESITHTITRGTASSSSSVRGGLGRHAAFATAMSSPAPTREYVYLGDRLVAITAGGSIAEVSVVVTIDDDDDPETPGVPALTNSLTLTEGHTGAYTLELGAEPTADVTIALSVSPGSDGVADVTVNPTSLTFTAADWDIPQWVTVSVGGDADTVGETETVSHTATSTDSRYQGIEITPVRIVIQDRNQTRIPTGTLTANPKLCGIEEGQTTCSTTLTWTSENTTAVHLRRITRTSNKVVVQSGQPTGNTSSAVGLGSFTFILYDYTSGSRGNQLASVSVKGFAADASAGVTISPTSLTITEGKSGSYTVVLDSQPTSTVTITGTQPLSLPVTSSPFPIYFTTSNWSTTQTVTVTASEDDNTTNETGNLTHTIVTTDPNYSGLSVPSVKITVDDNDDSPGVTISPTSLTITEGKSGSYTVVLDSQPTSSVTITGTQPLSLPVTSSPFPIYFTTSNWSTTQTVTVTASEDDNTTNETGNLTHTIVTTDPNYSGLSLPDVKITVDDNDDSAGVTISPTSLTITEGKSGSYTVVLDSQPTSTVTITGTQPLSLPVTSNPFPIYFTTSNWSTTQTVTVTASEDANTTDETGNLTHTIVTTDPNYSGLSLPSVKITVDDNDDSAGVTISPTSLTITEGRSGSYTVVLDSQPTSSVTITGTQPLSLPVTSNPFPIYFTTSNWSTTQTVTVTASEDANTTDETGNLTHTIVTTDPNYNGLSLPDVKITVRDNDAN